MMLISADMDAILRLSDSFLAIYCGEVVAKQPVADPSAHQNRTNIDIK
jgi:ABC-type uncharacterized transport system ATPase subunit